MTAQHNIHLLYFASLAEAVGVRQEILPLGSHKTLADLRNYLTTRGPQWHVLLDKSVRMAINQEVASADHAIAAGNEIAFFPPVTGG